MGADGGITWVRVLDRKRFGELVTPFGVNRYDDYHDSDHEAYLKKWPLPADYVVATYGTDHDIQGFDTLRAMLREAEDLKECYDVEADGTFVDILMSEYTLPSWRAAYRGEIVRSMLYYAGYCRYPHDPENYSASLKRALDKYHAHPVMNMCVSTWAKDTIATIDPKTFGSAETWT